MIRRLWRRYWPPARRRDERIYELRWDLWFHCLKLHAVSLSPLAHHFADDDEWFARYREITDELKELSA